jgi:hypothetical protein
MGVEALGIIIGIMVFCLGLWVFRLLLLCWGVKINKGEL